MATMDPGRDVDQRVADLQLEKEGVARRAERGEVRELEVRRAQFIVAIGQAQNTERVGGHVAVARDQTLWEDLEPPQMEIIRDVRIENMHIIHDRLFARVAIGAKTELAGIPPTCI